MLLVFLLSMFMSAPVLMGPSPEALAADSISYVGDIGSATIKDNTVNDLVVTTSAAANAGDDIVIVYATDPAQNLVVAVTDSAGNTYEEVAVAINQAQVRTHIYAAFNALALPSGSTITISYVSSDTAAPIARAAVVSVFNGLADSEVVDQTSTGENDASTTASSGATETTTQADELLIGGIGTEGPNGDTPGTWQDSFTTGQRLGTTGGDDATNVTVSMGWRIVSAVGSYTASKTGMTARDHASAIATFKAAPSTDPTITITGTPLEAFNSQPGSPSAEQSYTVSGSNLTADIAITAPTDFEISETSGSGFGSTVTLTQSGGAVPATPIYVRFNRATTGTSSGDITHTSTGATTQNVAVSGTATPIVLDGTVSSNTATTGSSISIAHTTGTGTNPLMLVGVSWNSGSTARTIDSVTFTPTAGSPTGLTEVVSHVYSSSPRNAAIYSLVSPSSGQEGTVTITFDDSVSNGIVAGVANFAGVDQTTPFGPSGFNDASSTTPSVTLEGLDGDELVFDTVFYGGSAPVPALTVDPSQVELWNDNDSNTRGAASTEQATGSPVTMSWSATSSIWVIVAVAINPAEVGTTYDLTMAVSPSGAGTTVPAEGVHPYPEDEVVDISATANTGYEFDSWTGDVADPNSASTTVTMNGNKTVTANFTAVTTYDLTMAVDPAGGGSTVPADGGTYTYNENTVVDITATANMWYAFDSWTGGVADPNSASTTVTMDGNKTVTANFVEDFTPGATMYRVNCGGDTLDMAPDKDFDALHFSDLTTIPGLTVSNVQDERSTTDTIDLSNVDPSLPMALFQTILIRGTTGQTMNYDFVVPDGDYNVLLHFAEHYFSEAGQRLFDVSIEGVLELENYDIFVAAGGEDIAVTETIPTTVSDGVLNLAITAQTSDAAIRGIEIVHVAETICYPLTLDHTGQGSNPTASPTNSSGCSTGEYLEGESITLSGAAADADWEVGSWYGTNANASTASSNSLTMPASTHSAGVNYASEDCNYAQKVLASSPIAYWRLDESSGTTAVNLGSLGAAVDGTYQTGVILGETSLVPGDADAAAGFDGSNGHVKIPNNDAINTGTSHAAKTFELWFEADSLTGRQVLYEQGGVHKGFNIYLDGATLWAGAWNDDPGTVTGAWVSTAVSAGTPYHVALVFDGSTQLVTGYLNGVGFGSEDTDNDAIPTHAGLIAIGGVDDETRWSISEATGGTESGYYFNGVIDEVVLYNTVLAESTIKEHAAGCACYALTLGHTGDGSDPTASPTNSTGCSAGEYLVGESITLSGALPDSGWLIDSWYGTDNNSSTANTNTVTMPGSTHSAGVNYTPEVAPTCYALTLSHSGQGTDPQATPANSPGCDPGEYVSGASINLSGAVPASGWEISSWTGTNNDTSTANTNTVTMPDSVHTASVNYTQITYALTMAVEPIGAGTTDPAVGVHSYAEGTVVDITATPAAGYTFDFWSGACTGDGTCQVTMDGDKTVTAHFAGVSYDLTIVVDPVGGGTTVPAAGVHSYADGFVVDITATSAAGYVFDHWSGACTGDGACQVTMDADKSVTAHFEEVVLTCYALTVSHSGQGSDPVATPANSSGCPLGEYVAGEVINLSSAVPDSGWEISGWTGTDDDASTESSNTVTMPASDHAVSVQYMMTYHYLYLPLILNDVSNGG